MDGPLKPILRQKTYYAKINLTEQIQPELEEVSDMEKILMLLLLIPILAGVFYFLYINGCLVINAKSALSFIGSPKGSSASFSACNGYIKRIVRFKADKIYTFTLNAELTKGDMTVELLDASKQVIMCLNRSNPRASIAVENKKRYYLVLHFKSATGKYFLNWD